MQGCVLLLAAACSLIASEASATVVHLDDENFDARTGILSGGTKGTWFVKFYAPWCGHCKKLAPVWDELAEQFSDDGEVSIAKIDCDENDSCETFEVEGYPTLRLFKGGDMYSYGGARRIDDLAEYVRAGFEEDEPEPIPQPKPDVESSVIVLDDANFEHLTQASTGATTGDWFVKFYAPWCGHCKNLAPKWDELAEVVKGGHVNIAKVDCTTSRPTCARFGVNGFPTLLYFRAGQYYDYDEARSVEALAQYATDAGYQGQTGTPVPGEPGMMSLALGQLEAVVMETEIYPDPMINAILIGLLLGAVLMSPVLIVCCVCGVFEEPKPGLPPPPPAGSVAAAKKDDAQAAAEPAASTAGDSGGDGDGDSDAAVRKRRPKAST